MKNVFHLLGDRCFFATPSHLRLSVFICSSNCLFKVEKRALRNQCKFLSIKAKDGSGRALKTY
jgi:hypothetical protein